MDLFGSIKEFHEKFGLEYQGDPQQLSAHMQQFRIKFLNEELMEYIKATIEGDIVEQLDALVDIVYVALGTAYLQGFDFNEAFRRVHQANMSKVRAVKPSDSKRGTSFDIVKPLGWQHPNLADLCRPIDYAIVHNDYELNPTVHEMVAADHNYFEPKQLSLDLIEDTRSCSNCGKANMCDFKDSMLYSTRYGNRCDNWRFHG